jgi:hypothetical protein
MMHVLRVRHYLTFAVLLCLLTQRGAAQAPVISSFTPTSGPVGTVVSITGSNFNTIPANNIVFFGAVKAAVITANANTLIVRVPAGATYEPFTVQNTSTHLAGYSPGIFKTTFLSINSLQYNFFDPPAIFNSGPSDHSYLQQGLVLNDFDGDGKVDILSSNVNTVSGQGLYVFRNITVAGTMNNTSFDAPLFITTGDNNTATVSLADIDGDGKTDVVVSNMNLHNKVVFRNTSTPGAISFATAVTINMFSNIWGITDIDGDGKPDLVGNSSNTSLDSIFVFRNQSTPGTISFTAPVFTNQYLDRYGTNARLSFHDMDGDGKMDIIYPGQFTSTTGVISWAAVIHRNLSTPGNIAIASQQRTDQVGGRGSMVISIADFDGDGKPDMASTTSSDYTVPANANKMAVWRNTSTGAGNLSFNPAVYYNTGIFPIYTITEDFDGDGKPELVTCDGNSTSLSVFRNTAVPGTINTSSFQRSFGMPLPYASGQIAAGDVDGDGKPDLVCLTSNNKVVVMRNNPPPLIKSAKNALCKGDDTKRYIISEKAGISAYQWEVNTGSGFVPVVNNATYAGATSDTLRITGVTIAMDGAVYRLKDVNNGQNKTSWNTDTLRVYEPPTVPVITSNNNVLSTAGIYATYQWLLNNVPIPGATNPAYTATQNGSYTLRVTNIYGCESASAAIVISGLSVETTRLAQLLKIYPNPASDELRIDAPFAVNVVVTDITGRAVLKATHTNNLQMGNLAEGVYTLMITDKDGLFIRAEKIVKHNR